MPHPRSVGSRIAVSHYSRSTVRPTHDGLLSGTSCLAASLAPVLPFCPAVPSYLAVLT